MNFLHSESKYKLNSNAVLFLSFQYFMVKEKKVPVYGQQKPTRKINKPVVKSYVGLRIPK